MDPVYVMQEGFDVPSFSECIPQAMDPPFWTQVLEAISILQAKATVQGGDGQTLINTQGTSHKEGGGEARGQNLQKEGPLSRAGRTNGEEQNKGA